MRFTVIGNVNQCVTVQMTHGDEIRADIANLVLLSDGVALEAISHGPEIHAAGHAEVGAPVGLTTLRCMASLGVVTFAAPYCGEPRQLEMHGGAWFCARDSFLFCSRDVTAAVGMVHAVPSGYFHAAGFVLYRLSGHGDAYIHCGGNVIEYDLVAGQRVTVDAGCVAAYQESVQPAVEALDVAPGAHGGSGPMFLLTLTGPGRIYLATLPLSRIRKH